MASNRPVLVMRGKELIKIFQFACKVISMNFVFPLKHLLCILDIILCACVCVCHVTDIQLPVLLAVYASSGLGERQKCGHGKQLILLHNIT